MKEKRLGGLGGGVSQNCFSSMGAKILLKKGNKQGGDQKDCVNLAEYNCNFDEYELLKPNVN